MNTFVNRAARRAKRLIIGIVGITVVLIGVVMIATPGPAILVIPIGLGILATEFAWAGRLLKALKSRLSGYCESRAERYKAALRPNPGPAHRSMLEAVCNRTSSILKMY